MFQKILQLTILWHSNLIILKSVFCWCQRCIDVFTGHGQKWNSAGWDDVRENVCDDENKDDPREGIHKKWIYSTDEVGTNKNTCLKLNLENYSNLQNSKMLTITQEETI